MESVAAYLVAVLAASLAGNILSAIMIQRLKNHVSNWRDVAYYWRNQVDVVQAQEQERTDVRI